VSARPFLTPFLVLSLLSASSLGCGEDEPPLLAAVRWRQRTSGPAAPPGKGPDARVLIASGGSAGELRTVEEANGRTIEGPFPTFPTERAPVAVGPELFLVTTIGRVVHLDLAGQEKLAPPGQLGRPSPIAVAADGSLRVASTSGRLLSFGADGTARFDAQVEGAVETAPAIAPDGTTYVATDTGLLVGFSPTGAEVFRASVPAPGSGPSTDGARVAVGALDAVVVFSAAGAEVLRHPRGARVVGTRFLSDGALVAWGEDGRVERIGIDGSVSSRFDAGQPIYTPVVSLPGDRMAVFDRAGVAHLVDAAGATVTTVNLGGEPKREVIVGDNGWVYVTAADEVLAIDFALQR
jgi:hypothetical protein